MKFHQIFRSMDRKGTGYISLNNLFEFMEEEYDSTMSPYLEYFFKICEKESNDKMSFIEWIPAISVYCLYTNDKLVEFVFKMIDEDFD